MVTFDLTNLSPEADEKGECKQYPWVVEVEENIGPLLGNEILGGEGSSQ